MPDNASKSSQSGARGASSKAMLEEDDLRERLGVAKPAARPEQLSRYGRALDHVKTLLWVVPLTLLIWVYAEREQLAPHTARIPIRIRNTAEDRVVTVLSPKDLMVDVDVKAPRASIDAFRSDLLAGKIQPPVIELGSDLPFGDAYELDISERLSKNELLTSRALNVQQVRPSLKISVEAKESRKVRVVGRPGDKVAGKVDFEPDAVLMEGPANLIRSLGPDQLVAEANLSELGRTVKPGLHEKSVPVAPPASLTGVTIKPQQVLAKMKIEEIKPQQLTLRIDVRMPALALRDVLSQKNIPVFPEPSRLQNVLVTGPPEAIDRIRKDEFEAAVIVYLTEEDLKAPGDKERRLSKQDYLLPEGVEVTNPDQLITFKVVKAE